MKSFFKVILQYLFMSEKQTKKDALDAFAASLNKVEEDDKQTRKSVLKKGVLEREEKKGTNIRSKMVQQQLTRIRSEADLSAFIGTGGKIKSPRFKRKEFLQLLAREVLLIGTEELTGTGGIISLTKLQQHFNETRKNWELRENDLFEAVEKLIKQDMIPRIEQTSTESLIYFKAIELSQDPESIIMAASGVDDLSIEILCNLTGWDIPRVREAVEQLEQSGIVITEGDTVYFPGL